MSFQLDLLTPTVKPSNSDHTVELLTWNVQSASLERARAQLEFLAGLHADAIVLTELKPASEALSYFTTSLQRSGYQIAQVESSLPGDYCTLLCVRASRVEPVMLAPFAGTGRVCAVRCDLGGHALTLVGAYAPATSEFADAGQLDAKRRFHTDLAAQAMALVQRGESLCLMGDLNFLEPAHVPKVHVYTAWEPSYTALIEMGLRDAYRHCQPGGRDHSWRSRNGVGQRLDHVFISDSLRPHTKTCRYVHEPRDKKLSDHSAMRLTLRSIQGETAT